MASGLFALGRTAIPYIGHVQSSAVDSDNTMRVFSGMDI